MILYIVLASANLLSIAAIFVVRHTKRIIEADLVEMERLDQAMQAGTRHLIRTLREAGFELTIDEPEDPELFAQLEDITVDEADIEDFSVLDDLQLLERFESVTAAIKAAQQLLSGVAGHRDTQAGRDLHSLRYAMQLELQRRGISIGLE